MNSSDFMTRASVPGQPAEEPARSSSTHKSGGEKHGPMKLIMSAMIVSLALLVMAVIALVVFGRSTDETKLIKEDRYQAVFLNDPGGQVYVGNLTALNSDYYVLTDVFYVQAGQIPSSDEGESQQTVRLVPLDTQIHGPENEMFIAKDKVLFWENLKADGKAAIAIEDYKNSGGTTDTTPDTDTEDTTDTPTPTPSTN